MRHTRPRRPRVLGLGVLSASVLLLAGCGIGGSGDPADTPLPPGANAELHAALPDAVKEAGVIRFAGDSHPPYRTVAGDGSITGIDRDFQDALARVLGVRTETVVVDSLPAALQGMLAGRYDAFNGPVKVTAERERQFDTVTWMTTRTSYVVPADSPLGVRAADDLCGRRVAVTTASVVEEQLRLLSGYCTRTGRPEVTSIGLADTNATLLAARSGRADAAGMTQAAAIDVTAQQQGVYTYVTQTEEQGATVDKLALYVPKSEELGPVMQRAFEELFRDGTYAGIMSRWGLDDVTVPAPKLNAGTTP